MKPSTVVWIIVVILVVVGAWGYFGRSSSSPTVSSSAPVVTAVLPTTGMTAGGDTVTITGTGFTGATAVDFGSTPAASFIFSSDTSVIATSPTGSAGPVDVTVITPNGTSAVSPADQFTYAESADQTAATSSSQTPDSSNQ